MLIGEGAGILGKSVLKANKPLSVYLESRKKEKKHTKSNIQEETGGQTLEGMRGGGEQLKSKNKKVLGRGEAELEV